MNALIRRLCEEDIPAEDTPEATEHYTKDDPGVLLAGALRDQLVEKGWRRIKIFKGDEDAPDDPDSWTLTASFVDWAYRSDWLADGARVAPRPNDSKELRAKLMNMFRGACRRVHVDCKLARVVGLRAVDDIDLYREYDDIEDIPGDWDIEMQLDWQPKPGFWSIASKATGYDKLPYQKKKEAEAIRSARTPSTQTDEPTEIQRRMQAIRARHGGREPEPESLETQAGWRDQVIKP